MKQMKIEEKALKKLTLEEIKAMLLEMLDDIAEVCKENNLRFFLSGGTLLGAVRHQGFIPWDDDIDLHMPRPDYEKFIEIYKSQSRKYKLYAPIFDEKYRYPFTKLINPKTLLIEKEANCGVDMGVFVDIFPLDGMGDSIESAKKVMQKIKWPIYLNLGLSVKKHRKNVSLLKNILVSGCFVLAVLSGGNNKIVRKIDKIAKTYSFENSKYAGEFVDEIGDRRINERKFYDETVYLDFEGRKCPAPFKYHEILTNFYGDYMKLPPVEKRVLVHNYDAFLMEEE